MGRVDPHRRNSSGLTPCLTCPPGTWSVSKHAPFPAIAPTILAQAGKQIAEALTILKFNRIHA